MDLTWLTEVLGRFADFVPRPLIVRADVKCVAFFFGRWPVAFGPGWYIHWPAFVEAEIVPTRRQSLDVEQQLFVDGSSTQMTTTVIWEVEDVLKLVLTTYDYEATIMDIVSIEVARTNRDTGGIPEDESLMDAIQEELSEYGVKITDVCVTSTADVFALRLIS